MYVIVPALRSLEQEAGLGKIARYWPPQPPKGKFWIQIWTLPQYVRQKREDTRCKFLASICTCTHTHVQTHIHVYTEHINVHKQNNKTTMKLNNWLLDFVWYSKH